MAIVPARTVGRASVDLILNTSGVTEGLSFTERAVAGLRDRVRGLTTGLGGFAGITGTILGSVSLAEAAQFEQALAGVFKTVDLGEEEIEKLGRRFRELSTEMPVAATELARLGQIAGQLGVKSAEDIERFAVLAAKMGVATDFASEEAAFGLARLRSVMRLTLSETEALASVMVRLGNTMATTEPEIGAMAIRIAPMAQSLDIAASEVLAISAALSEFGLRAEAGGSSAARLLAEVQKISAGVGTKGSQRLKLLSMIVGETAENFQEIAKRDPAEAFIRLIEGIGELQVAAEAGGEGSAEMLQVLDDLGFSNVRLSQTILASAGGIERFRMAVAEAKKEFADPTALNREVERFFKTTLNRLSKLRNAIKEVAVTIGFAFLPFLDRLIGLGEKVVSFLQRAADAFAALPQPIREFIAALTLFSFLGTFTVAILKFTGAFLLLQKVLAALGIGIFTTIVVAFRGTGKAAGLAATQIDKLAMFISRRLGPALKSSLKTSTGIASKAIFGLWLATIGFFKLIKDIPGELRKVSSHFNKHAAAATAAAGGAAAAGKGADSATRGFAKFFGLFTKFGPLAAFVQLIEKLGLRLAKIGGPMAFLAGFLLEVTKQSGLLHAAWQVVVRWSQLVWEWSKLIGEVFRDVAQLAFYLARSLVRDLGGGWNRLVTFMSDNAFVFHDIVGLLNNVERGINALIKVVKALRGEWKQTVDFIKNNPLAPEFADVLPFGLGNIFRPVVERIQREAKPERDFSGFQMFYGRPRPKPKPREFNFPGLSDAKKTDAVADALKQLSLELALIEEQEKIFKAFGLELDVATMKAGAFESAARAIAPEVEDWDASLRGTQYSVLGLLRMSTLFLDKAEDWNDALRDMQAELDRVKEKSEAWREQQEALKEALEEATEVISTPFQNALREAQKQAAKFRNAASAKLFEAAQTTDPALRARLQAEAAILNEAADVLVDRVTGLTDEFAEIGKEAGRSLVQGIIQGTFELADFLRNVIAQIADIFVAKVFEEHLRIGSPSKLAMGWGKNIMEGLASGMLGNADMVKFAARSAIPAMSPTTGRIRAVGARTAGVAGASLHVHNTYESKNIDSRDTGQFFQQNGRRIARENAEQLRRSMALRKHMTRGVR